MSDAHERAFDLETTALREQHARAVEALRRERLDRARTDALRDEALRAAREASERLKKLELEVAVAKAEDATFKRHAKALNEALKAQHKRDALELSEARALLALEREKREVALAAGLKAVLRHKRSTKSVLEAVDDVCADVLPEPRRRPPPPTASRSLDRPPSTYLRRGAAKARFEEKRRGHLTTPPSRPFAP